MTPIGEAPTGHLLDEVADLVVRARHANAVGRYADAERLLRRGLRRLNADAGDATDGDATRLDEARARLLTTMALTLLVRQGRRQALDTLDQARRLSLRSGSRHAWALTYVQEAAVHVWCTDWPAALAALDVIRGDVGLLTPRERTAALLNRGLAHTSLLQHAKGREALSAALHLAHDNNLPEQEFKARHNLGCLAFFTGDLPGAIRLMREADRMDVDVSRARARLDYAVVLLEAGLLDEAEANLEAALASAREAGLRLEQGDIELDVAQCSVLRGDIPLARAHATRAVAAYRSRGADDQRERARLIRAAIDVAAGERLRNAATVARTFLARPGLTAADANLATRVYAEASVLRSDLPSAAEAVARLKSVRPAGAAEALHLRLIEARLAVAVGDVPAARRVAGGAARILAQQQRRAPSLEIRAGLALHGLRIGELDLRLAVESGSPRQVFDSVERWRATSQRLVAASPPAPTDPSGPPAPGSSGDSEASDLVAELRRTQLRLMGGEGDLPGLRAEVARLQALVAEVEWSTAQDPEAATADLSTLSYAQALAASRGGVGILSFFVLDGAYHRLSIDDGRATLRPVGPVAGIDELVERLDHDLSALAYARVGTPVREAVRRSARGRTGELDRILLEGMPPETPLVIAPARALASVPWGMLPSLAGRPVTVAPSLTAWARPRDVSARSHITAPVVALSGPGLHRAQTEAETVAAIWKGFGAGVRAAVGRSVDVGEALAHAVVVHLAAHGRHESQSPMFSHLRMDDGPVYAYEFPRQVRAEHVVLSACDLGRSRIRAGDEPLGLTSALLSLGVRAVVAAVAPVPDEAAEAVMAQYHRGLASGRDAAVALAEAMAAVPDAQAFCLYGANWSADGIRPAGVGRAGAGSAGILTVSVRARSGG